MPHLESCCMMLQAVPASAASLWAAAKRWRGHIEKFLAAGDPLTFSMMSALMCGRALRGRFVESASAPLTAFVSNWGCTGILERYCIDEVCLHHLECVGVYFSLWQSCCASVTTD